MDCNYIEGVRSGILRAATWLREHGYAHEYSVERGGDNNYWIDCPDPDKLADELERLAQEE